MKTSSNLWLSNVFRKYRKRLLAWHGLKWKCCTCSTFPHCLTLYSNIASNKCKALKQGEVISLFTTRKASEFGVLLVRFFPHPNWIRRFNQQVFVFSLNAVKYRPEKNRNSDTFCAVILFVTTNKRIRKAGTFFVCGSLMTLEGLISFQVNFVCNFYWRRRPSRFDSNSGKSMRNRWFQTNTWFGSLYWFCTSCSLSWSFGTNGKKCCWLCTFIGNYSRWFMNYYLWFLKNIIKH